MSVFGVDFGTLNSVVAVTRQGGVDIVCNEVSKRETATFVCYNNDERLIGEAGFDKVVRNTQNTVSCVKRLIGLRKGDARLEQELRFVNCNTAFDADGRLQIEVDYNGEMTLLYPEQVLAAFLGKLKKYVVLTTKMDAKDCVITVPVWYGADQRALIIQACEIAGLSSLSLINETTASAVDYGIFRVSMLPEAEAEAQVVAIVDVGNAGTTITIGKFWKGNMKVLAHVWSHEVSTRELDWALYQHFATEIQKKYKVDVSTNRRAQVRLLQGCDKLKCMLSANLQAPLNIENLMDVDVSFMYTRDELNVTLDPLCEKLRALCKRAMAKAGVESVMAAEMIGGGSRVPGYKQAVSDGFGVQSGFTLNASESIARGAAITAAMFSPLFQVREYVVNEAPVCPIVAGYNAENPETTSQVSFLPDVNKTSIILRDTDRYPKTIEYSIKHSQAFDLYAFYDENAQDAVTVPSGKNSIVGHWRIGGANGKTTDGNVKLRIKFHASGLMTVDSATTHETYEVEVEEPASGKATSPAPDQSASPAPEGEGSPASAEAAAAPQRTKKQQRRRLDLTVTPQRVLGLPSELVLKCKKVEAAQDAQDLTIQKTREVRNELEAYVYDNRSRVRDGDLQAFVTDADRNSFVTLADEIENWLYGDGDSAPLNEYQTRLDKLKVIGAACIRRQRLSEEIPFAKREFDGKVQALRELAAAKSANRPAHITAEEMDGAITKCDEALMWATKELDAYLAKPKPEDPALAPSTFDNKLKEVDAAVKAVINKKAPPPPKKEEKPADKKDDKPAADGEKPAAATEEPASPASEGPAPVPPADLD